VTTGLGPVYDGIAHFALSPKDLIAVGGLALLAALRGPTHGAWALFTVSLFWLLGAAVPGQALGLRVPTVVPAVVFLVVGGLAAADVRLPVSISTVLAATVGLIRGCSNGVALPGDRAGLLNLAGMTTAVFVFFALCIVLIFPIRSHLARIAVRICGSSIAATGVLLLGWSIRGAGSISN